MDYNKNALDIFRIIATVQIFLGHIITHFAMNNPPVNAVYFARGVPILFVLCGFLAAKSLEGRSTKKWLIGRAARILPGFWTCIAINTAIILLIYETKPTFLEAAVYGVTQVFGMNFYTGDWLRGYGVGVPNGVLWTIPVQIQFFLLVPLLAKLLRRSNVLQGGVIVAILSLLSIFLQKANAFLPEIVNKLIGVTAFPYLYFLIAGMVGWYHRDAIIPALKKWKWVVLAVYIAWKLMENHLAFPHIFDGVLYNTVTTLLVAALIFAFGFCGNWRLKKDLSFGFYLYHMVFINLAVHLGYRSLEPATTGMLLVLGIALATLVTAWLTQRYVEAPCTKLLLKEK